MVFKRIRLPQRLLERLAKIFPANKIDSVLHAFSVKRPTTIRANTIKIEGRELRQRLMDQSIKLDTVFWYKDAFIVRNRDLRGIQSLPEYHEGLFYVQSLSSMIPALILDPKPREKILDLAAAPGSKTTQMAAIMENKGEIVANEPNSIRYQILNANLKVQGVKSVKTISMRGEIIRNLYSDYFDKALVDAPCSSDGRISVFYQNSFKHWSYRDVKDYSLLQKKLLISALLSVKPGGTVVYSTCALSPEENEEVISSVLEKSGGLVKTEPVRLNTYQFAPPILNWEGKLYHRGVRNCARVYPSDLMEGFFIAKLKRIK